MLRKADIFREGDEWFMHLEYEYEDNRGKHLVTLPKATFPHSLWHTPIVVFSPFELEFPAKICSSIEINENLVLYESDVTDPLTNKTINACYTDIIVEPKIHELTLDEIEKNLDTKSKSLPTRKENKHE